MSSGMVLILGVAGCASDDDHAYEAPPPQPQPVIRPAPSPPIESGVTLSRVKTEAQRRKRVLRQLDRIFEESRP